VTTSLISAGTVKLRLLHSRSLPLETVFRGCYPLAPQAFQRSLKTNQALDSRLQRVIGDARRGRHLVVAVDGGSVACGVATTVEKLHDKQMDGACHIEKSSSSLFVQWLRKRYPNASFSYFNLAHPGTTTVWLLSHFEVLRDTNPDLVIYGTCSRLQSYVLFSCLVRLPTYGWFRLWNQRSEETYGDWHLAEYH
jgi:hypothetical protein